MSKHLETFPTNNHLVSAYDDGVQISRTETGGNVWIRSEEIQPLISALVSAGNTIEDHSLVAKRFEGLKACLEKDKPKIAFSSWGKGWRKGRARPDGWWIVTADDDGIYVVYNEVELLVTIDQLCELLKAASPE